MSELWKDPEIKGFRLREQEVHFYRDVTRNLNFNTQMLLDLQWDYVLTNPSKVENAVSQKCI